jgi:hypothetical protein
MKLRVNRAEQTAAWILAPEFFNVNTARDV